MGHDLVEMRVREFSLTLALTHFCTTLAHRRWEEKHQHRAKILSDRLQFTSFFCVCVCVDKVVQ